MVLKAPNKILSPFRGAFYLDKDDDVYKQDFSGPTLDDHFDKTVLPKVCMIYIIYVICRCSKIQCPVEKTLTACELFTVSSVFGKVLLINLFE